MPDNKQLCSSWQCEDAAYRGRSGHPGENQAVFLVNLFFLLATLLATAYFRTTFIGLVFLLSIVAVLSFSLILGAFYVLRAFLLPDHLGRARDVYDGLGFFGWLSFWIASGLVALWVLNQAPAEFVIGTVSIVGILGVLAFPFALFFSSR